MFFTYIWDQVDRRQCYLIYVIYGHNAISIMLVFVSIDIVIDLNCMHCTWFWIKFDKKFVDRTRIWKVSYTISERDLVIGRDNGPREK